MSKTIPLSVRISQDDASFLARVSLPGAVTPSEKVRALIAQARERQQSEKHPAEAAYLLTNLFEARLLEIRRLEERSGLHSEFMIQLGSWLPRFIALVLNTPLSRDRDPNDALQRFERGAVREVISLVEKTLRLAVTREEPCYDPHVIASQVAVVKELIDLIFTNRLADDEATADGECREDELQD